MTIGYVIQQNKIAAGAFCEMRFYPLSALKDFLIKIGVKHIELILKVFNSNIPKNKLLHKAIYREKVKEKEVVF